MDSAERRTPRPVGAVIDMAHVDAGMMPAVGGKGANLGVLLAAGLPVPDGFCVTTAAYRRVAASAGLDPILEALQASFLRSGASAGRTASGEGEPGLAELAEQTRTKLESLPMAEGIIEAILAAYASLGENGG